MLNLECLLFLLNVDEAEESLIQSIQCEGYMLHPSNVQSSKDLPRYGENELILLCLP